MFRVKIEREAKDNLREHYLNLRKQSSASGYAVEWYRGIRAAIRNLETSAQRCGTAYEDRYFREHIRHRLYDSLNDLRTFPFDKGGLRGMC